MQVIYFSNGGFVMHKVEGKYSLWFAKDGELLDGERRNARGVMRKLSRTDHKRLAKLGPIWVKEGGK